ncbi:8483_t:CDS:1, partial [Funneliformis geosporum]
KKRATMRRILRNTPLPMLIDFSPRRVTGPTSISSNKLGLIIAIVGNRKTTKIIREVIPTERLEIVIILH